jgi:hypothetical protein
MSAMSRLIPLLAASAAAAGLTASLSLADAEGDHHGRNGSYAIGLWGDLPYDSATSDVQTTLGVPRLIADMNASRLAFSVHDGDIKSGSTRCDDEVYARFEGFLDALRAPALYTPGDNEWTDCDRPTNGPYVSGERLEHIRATLFDTPYSHGRRRIRLQTQAPPAQPYTENRRWNVGPVTYATLHVVGSDNNCSGDVAPDPAECAGRIDAATRWIRETFARAARRGSAAVMLIAQGNPGFDRTDDDRAPSRDPQTLLLDPDDDEQTPDQVADGYTEILRTLRAETVAFAHPVAFVHGDSHYFRIDRPLLDAKGDRIEWLTRVETPGDNQQSGTNDVQWLKVKVDPQSPAVFAYEPRIVRENVVPYTP